MIEKSAPSVWATLRSSSCCARCPASTSFMRTVWTSGWGRRTRARCAAAMPSPSRHSEGYIAHTGTIYEACIIWIIYMETKNVFYKWTKQSCWIHEIISSTISKNHHTSSWHTNKINDLVLEHQFTPYASSSGLWETSNKIPLPTTITTANWIP